MTDLSYTPGLRDSYANQMTPEIVGKIERGDPLSDSELTIALMFYTRLCDDITKLGQRFYLPRMSVFQERDRLEGFARARGWSGSIGSASARAQSRS